MSYEQRCAWMRMYLVDLVLALIALALCAGIRLTFVLTDEIHQARVDLAAQIAALNTTAQNTGNRLDSRTQDIASALHTFGKRVDSNITDTRATLQNIGKTATTSTVQQIKETREALNDKLDAAAQNLAVVALKAEDPKAPMQIAIPPVIIPPALPAPPGPPASEPVQHQKKKRGFWKRILPWK